MKPLLFYSVLFSLLLGSTSAFAQRDLREHQMQLYQSSQYFSNWLKMKHLHTIFKIDSVQVQAHKATIHIGSAKEFAPCDSVEYALNLLEIEHFERYRNFFKDSMLIIWQKVGKLAPNEAEVIIGCQNPPTELIRMFGKVKKSQNKPQTVLTSKGVSRGEVRAVPNKKVQVENTTDNSTVITNMRAEKVCALGKKFCEDWYSTRGTWFFDADVKKKLSLDNEFIYEVTYIKNDICPDGFFEYHRIHAFFEQDGSDVAVRLEFEGKYGSGIIFAPRLNGYKDMKRTYKTELEHYQVNFFKSFIQAITKQ